MGERQSGWNFASSPRTYFGLLVGVPGERNSIVGNLLDVADGVETLLVVSCGERLERVGERKEMTREGVSFAVTSRYPHILTCRQSDSDLIPITNNLSL